MTRSRRGIPIRSTALFMIIAFGLPIKMGFIRVATSNNLLMLPAPGKSPRSVGIFKSGLVPINIAPFAMASVAMVNFS